MYVVTAENQFDVYHQLFVKRWYLDKNFQRIIYTYFHTLQRKTSRCIN